MRYHPYARTNMPVNTSTSSSPRSAVSAVSPVSAMSAVSNPTSATNVTNPSDPLTILHYKKRMMMTHLGIEPWIDTLQAQTEPLDLSKHAKLETQAVLYECKLCTHTFTLLERLKAHERRHEIKNSGRYTCEICSKPFVQQSSLITHRRIHTGEKPYRCKICNKSYGDLSTFTKHQRTHSGEKPYQCHFCDRRFSQSGNCLRHKRSIHADLMASSMDPQDLLSNITSSSPSSSHSASS